MGLLQLSSTGEACEQEACWGPHGRFRGKIYTSAPSAASFEFTSIAEMGLCHFRVKGFYRSEPIGSRHIGRYCSVVLQLHETIQFEANGVTAELRPHHWALSDQSQPVTATGRNGTDSLIVMVPRARLMEKGDALNMIATRPFSGATGVGKLVWQFISSVFDELPNLNPRLESGLVDTISQLVRLAVTEYSGDSAIHSQTRVLRERAKAYILSHLRDPELDADCIAAELNCTKRYLHKVFEMEEVSVCDYIRQLRLDRCREEILAPAHREKSITEIAFSWGFNSSAHFSAAFKERFGPTPSLYRQKEFGSIHARQ